MTSTATLLTNYLDYQAFHKLDLTVDVFPLQKKLVDNPQLFGRYDYRAQGNSPHKDMTDIWVRYRDIAPHLASGDFSTFADEHVSVWYPVHHDLPEVDPIIDKIYSAVNGETLGGILITKLPPGKQITAHTDSGWHAATYDKYFVPIKNDKGAVFSFVSGDIEPELGQVYQFDNSKLHWVKNNSTEDRIAMIVCVRSIS